MTTILQERLLPYVEPDLNGGCWLWSATIGSAGYGKLTLSMKTVSAHRLSWELHYGPIPDGLCVCHRCDVRACVNPAHLFLGTYEDNMADMHRKGRRPGRPGERNSQAKITDAVVREIRRSPESQRELAARLGVSQSLVGGIRLHQRWSHVT